MKQATKATRSNPKNSKASKALKASAVHRLLGLEPMEPKARRRSKKAAPKRASVKAAKPTRPETLGASVDVQKEALRFADESERSRGSRVAQHLRKTPTQRVQAHAGSSTRRQQRKHEIKNALPPDEL